eukprot:75916_1
MSSTEFITAIVVISVLILVFFPIATYFLWHYVSVKHRIIVANRQPNMTIFTCVALILLMSFQTSFSWASLLTHHKSTSHLLHLIQQSVYPFTSQAAVYGFLSRICVARYNFKIAIAQSTKWRQYITSKSANITLRSPGQYAKWIGRRFLCTYAVSSSFCSIIFMISYTQSHVISISIAHWIDLIFYLIPLISMFVCWKITPRFQDNIFLRQEISWIIFLMMAMIVSYMVNIVVTSLIPFSPVARRLWSTVNVTFVCFGCIFVQTQWVYKKMNNIGCKTNEMKLNNAPSAATMLQVLEDENGFNAFANHLNSEFCIEIILSLIELTQYRQRLQSEQGFMEYVKENTETQPRYSNIYIVFPKDVPKSDIVYGSTSDDGGSTDIAKCQEIITKLYNKYISEQSEFCVNISDMTRRNITQWILNYKENENCKREGKVYFQMYSIFDKCCQELHQLLSYSWYRFKMTPGYQQNMMLCSFSDGAV